MSHHKGWMTAFVITFLLLIVILVLAIVDYNSYCQKRYRISLAIQNTNQCAGSNSGICELHINFELSVPSDNPSTYSQTMALFMANLVGSVEYSFLQAPSGSTQPVMLMPSTVTKIADIVYNGNTIGVVCSGGSDFVFVAFRGTRTSQEWDQDLMFQQVSYPHSTFEPVATRYYSLRAQTVGGAVVSATPPQQVSSPYFPGLVHEGFLNVYDCIRTQLQTAINSVSNPNVVVGGHSLGGALSMILCADVFGSKSKTGYVFGCPRVGNAEFAEFLNSSTAGLFRVTNLADIVCDLPPAVTPNFNSDPDDVYLYTHAGNATNFETNRGALLYNHAMECYLDFLR